MQNEPLFQFRKSPHGGRRVSRPVHARSAASPDLRTYHPGASKKPGRSSTGGAAGSGHPIFHKKERRPEIFRRSFQSKSLKTIRQPFQSPPVANRKGAHAFPRRRFQDTVNNAPRSEKESLTQGTPMRRRNGHQMMTREPRRIKIPPAITLRPTVSCRKINASTMVNTTLSLSIGATLETSPVSSALK